MRMLRTAGILLAACIVLSSCSTYRVVGLPPVDEPAPVTHVKVVKPNTPVRVTLRDGRVVKGDVLRASATELVLGVPANYGTREDVYPAADIASIEVSELTQSGKAAFVGFFVVTAAAFAAILQLSASGGFG